MKYPLVSVVLPVYNAELFIAESIESILTQTYKNIELIIIDDNSRDKSWKIISTYQSRYPSLIRAIHLNHNMNKGGDTCANIGIQMAKGSLIARMDADDISDPTRIEKQVDFLMKNKQVFMVGSSADVIDKQGKIIGEKLMPENNEQIYNEYMVFHPIIHPSVVFRNNVIKRKNFYLSKFSANNDYYTFFNLISQGRVFANLPEKLLKYRIYGNNNSLKTIKANFFNTLKARLFIARKYGYPISLKILLMNFIQLLTIILLPEKMIYYSYLLSRGIITPKSIALKLKSGFLAGIFHQQSTSLVS